MSVPHVEDLVREGLLDRVRPDIARSRELLADAQTHLTSAELIAHGGRDLKGAYALLYDAARKAVAAHMLANGLRSKADRPGAHWAIVLYAECILAASHPSIERFDEMRRRRNRAE